MKNGIRVLKMITLHTEMARVRILELKTRHRPGILYTYSPPTNFAKGRKVAFKKNACSISHLDGENSMSNIF